jgi:hypothetical protein
MRRFGGPVSPVVLYTKTTDNQDRCTIAPELLDLFLRLLRRPLRKHPPLSCARPGGRPSPLTRFSFLGVQKEISSDRYGQTSSPDHIGADENDLIHLVLGKSSTRRSIDM